MAPPRTFAETETRTGIDVTTFWPAYAILSHVAPLGGRENDFETRSRTPATTVKIETNVGIRASVQRDEDRRRELVHISSYLVWYLYGLANRCRIKCFGLAQRLVCDFDIGCNFVDFSFTISVLLIR